MVHQKSFNRSFVILSILLAIFQMSFAQQKVLRYSIVSRGDTVGRMQMTQTLQNNQLLFSINSDVLVKAIITVKMQLQEESKFIGGKLEYSSIKRYTNDKLKIDKKTRWAGDHYTLTDEDEESQLNSKGIGYNFAMLFYKEPSTTSKIYSDTYQKFFDIEPQGNHVYQIKLPDATNTYYYENNVLRKINLKNTLFTAQMILES